MGFFYGKINLKLGESTDDQGCLLPKSVSACAEFLRLRLQKVGHSKTLKNEDTWYGLLSDYPSRSFC